MENKKIIYALLIVFGVIILFGVIYFMNITNIPSSDGKLIVKNSAGQNMLIAECANPSYVEETSDYILEGELISSETKWVENVGSEGRNIYTYSEFKINNYIKGEPFEEEMIQIVTMGGCIDGMCQSVEDGPIISTGKKRLYITTSDGEFSIHGCGGIKNL